MNDKAKQEIIDFLKSEKPDIKEAVKLLTDHGTNPAEVRVFCGSPQRYIMQIRWALAKAIGIGLMDFQRGYFTDIRKKEEKNYPAVITRIKEVLPVIFKERALLQKQLTELGDSNDEETVAEAKEIGDKIDALSIRHQLLDEAKEAYFNSEGELLPEESELFPEEKEEGDDNAPVVVKYDWEGDKAAAQKRKTNLGSSMTKDRNLLKYQSKSKPQDGKDNPMPQGSEYDKVVGRLQEKEAEMEALVSFLDEDAGSDK